MAPDGWVHHEFELNTLGRQGTTSFPIFSLFLALCKPRVCPRPPPPRTYLSPLTMRAAFHRGNLQRCVGRVRDQVVQRANT